MLQNAVEVLGNNESFWGGSFIGKLTAALLKHAVGLFCLVQSGLQQKPLKSFNFVASFQNLYFFSKLMRKHLIAIIFVMKP